MPGTLKNPAPDKGRVFYLLSVNQLIIPQITFCTREKFIYLIHLFHHPVGFLIRDFLAALQFCPGIHQEVYLIKGIY
ncbi:MAG: hypothetical protein NTV89_05530 [Proteobacteria bacterium]|nr:hypothetical protein [Pseudomonadota bacterium]